MTADPRYIVVKGTAGLGNRMLAVLNAALYAKLSGRELVVDWTDWHFADRGENYFPLLFSSPAFRGLEVLPRGASVRPAIWAGHESETASDLGHRLYPQRLGKYESVFDVAIDVKRLAYPETVVMFWSWDQQVWRMRRHFKGSFAELGGMSDWEVLKRLASEHLRATPIVREQVECFKREHFGPFVLGVHVRHTDRLAPLSSLHRAVRRLLRGRDDARLFLATDNQAVLEDFRRTYKGVIVRPKSFPEGGKPIHGDYWSEGKLARAVDALTEMHLLAECNSLLYARRSTFSYMAHLLSRIPAENVTDVDRYNARLAIKGLIQRRIARPIWRLRSAFERRTSGQETAPARAGALS